MGKHILLEVKESSSHLRNLIRKETNPKNGVYDKFPIMLHFGIIV